MLPLISSSKVHDFQAKRMVCLNLHDFQAKRMLCLFQAPGSTIFTEREISGEWQAVCWEKVIAEEWSSCRRMAASAT